MAALFNTSIRFMFTSNKTFLVHVPVVYFNDQSVLQVKTDIEHHITDLLVGSGPFSP